MKEWDEDLSPQERARVDALPRDRAPDATLEDRTVAALVSRGLLGRRVMWRTVVALAASLLIFLAGYALGRSSDARRPPATNAAAQQVVWF